MDVLSVIIPAHDAEATLRDALASVEESAACLRDHQAGGTATEVEVVIVDDGSADATLRIALEMARGKGSYRVIHRPVASSPACARNAGVAASRGDLVFFLDDDDRFLPDHLRTCREALRDPTVALVKTGVALSDPVHPDWAARIGNSLVINLAVRRARHDAIGGFPDYHLARRDGEGFAVEADVFRMIEDVFYNMLLAETSRGVRVEAETAVYRRVPGNSFDRQYEKFTRPCGSWPEEPDPDFDFRVKLAQLIFERQKRRLVGGTPGRGIGPVPPA